MLTRDHIVRWLDASADVLQQNKTYLTELDAAIGDADHGINMDRGFQKIKSQLADLTGADIGTIFKTVAMTLISTVGGASGPLYGTMFLRGSTVVAGKQALTADELATMLQAFVDGVVQRGRAERGEKTMLDALIPAVEAYQRAQQDGVATPEAVCRAVAAAKNGVAETIPMVATKGRASYLGDRSAGHQDPGATSVFLLLKTLQETLQDGGWA